MPIKRPALPQLDRPDHDSAASSPCLKAIGETAPAPVSARIAQWRHAAGLSVEALSNRTKIKRHYIEALEAGDFSMLPPVAFAAGYVKIIAQNFGQDGDQLSRDFRREAVGTSRAPALAVLTKAETTRKAAQNPRTAGQSVSAMALGGFGIVAAGALWGFFSLVQMTSPSPHIETPAPSQPSPAKTGPQPVAVAKAENQVAPSGLVHPSSTRRADDRKDGIAQTPLDPVQSIANTADMPATRHEPIARARTPDDDAQNGTNLPENLAPAKATAGPAGQGTAEPVKSITEPRKKPAPAEKTILAQKSLALSAAPDKETMVSPQAQGDEAPAPRGERETIATQPPSHAPKKQPSELSAPFVSPPSEPQSASPTHLTAAPLVSIIRGPTKTLPTDRSLNRLTGLSQAVKEPSLADDAQNAIAGHDEQWGDNPDLISTPSSAAPEKSPANPNGNDTLPPPQKPVTPIIQPATLSERFSPDYPARCERRARSRETVTIRFTLSEFGTVQNARISETTNRCFTEAALDAVRQWRYNPRLKDGKPVQSTEKSVSIRFDQRR